LRYKQSIIYLALGIITLLFVSSITISYTSLYAQKQQQLKQNNSTSTAIAGVKITSPARDQQVPVGSLKISGTSKVTVNSNDCTVYAIWDHLKPYQKVLANGPGGANDYSKWSFTYTSVYHLITNGTNELTAKISCLSSSPSPASNLTKWYSINVTGVAAPLNQTKMPVPTTTTTPNTTTSDTASSSVLTNSSLFPSPLTRVNLNNSSDNNNDDEDSSNGKVDKNKGDHKEDNTASNNNNNNNDDDSKTNNSSPKPHDKDDNSKSKTATHHHDSHGEKEAKHIIKEKIKEVKHKIKHLKNEINKEISKDI
jgi:hypothetical protein